MSQGTSFAFSRSWPCGARLSVVHGPTGAFTYRRECLLCIVLHAVFVNMWLYITCSAMCRARPSRMVLRVPAHIAGASLLHSLTCIGVRTTCSATCDARSWLYGCQHGLVEPLSTFKSKPGFFWPTHPSPMIRNRTGCRKNISAVVQASCLRCTNHLSGAATILETCVSKEGGGRACPRGPRVRQGWMAAGLPGS